MYKTFRPDQGYGIGLQVTEFWLIPKKSFNPSTMPNVVILRSNRATGPKKDRAVDSLGSWSGCLEVEDRKMMAYRFSGSSYACCFLTSRKHAYINLTPLNPTFI